MPKVEIMSFQTQGQQVRDFVPAGGYVQGGKNLFKPKVDDEDVLPSPSWPSDRGPECFFEDFDLRIEILG